MEAAGGKPFRARSAEPDVRGNIAICGRCGRRYDWRTSKAGLRFTFCSSPCQAAADIWDDRDIVRWERADAWLWELRRRWDEEERPTVTGTVEA